MSTLLAIGLANATCAALLAVPAFLASRHGRRPALAHALWLLVLLKLVTPPLFRPPLAWLPAEDEPAPAVAAAPAPTAEPAPTPLLLTFVASRSPDAFAPPPALPLVEGPSKAMVVKPLVHLTRTPPQQAPPAPPASPPPAEPAPQTAPHDPARGALALLVALWAAGAAVCLARSAVHVARFRRLVVRHARPAAGAIQQQADELAARLGLRRGPRVWLIPGAVPPMVWGLGRAVILFPAGLLEHLGPEERASLLLHELAHVRRRDHWVRWLELAALSLFWWYPLAWWARGRMLQHEEECCDAWASGESSPRVYATAMLGAVDFLAGARPRLPAVASPLSGVASLKQRLTLVLTARPPRQLGAPARLAMLALAVAVLPLVPTLAREDRAPAGAARPEADAPPEPTDFPAPAVRLVGGETASYTVTFSPDGRFLAAGTGTSDQPGAVELFDVSRRKPVWVTREVRGVASVSFSSDSKRLAWAGWGGALRARDLTTRKDAFSLHVPSRNSRIAHSADGKWLALASEDRSLQLRRPDTGQLVEVLRGATTDFYSVAFSPDSKLLAAAGGHFQRADGAFAVVYDVSSRKQVARLDGHTRAVINVAFAPRNAYIATASADSTVQVFDGKTYKLRHVLRGHTAGVKGLAFSPDGGTLATGSWDSTVRLWDVARGQELARLGEHRAAVREVAFSPKGDVLATAGDLHTVKLWDVKGLKELATLREAPAAPPPGAPAPVAMALSPDGQALALGMDNGRVVLRDPRTAEVRRTLHAHDDAVTALAYSRDSKLLATAGPDTLVKVWAADGKLVHSFKGHTSWVYSLAFSRDGLALASGSYDRTVRVWPLGQGQPRVLTGHKASVRALVFTPDGKGLISGGADRTIRVWDLPKGASRAVLKGHEGAVRGLELAEGGKVLLSAGEDGLLKRWDLARHAELTSVKAAYQGPIRAFSLSPGGRVLAAGNDGGSLMLYDPARLSLYHSRGSVHQDGFVQLAFSPGARQLFTLGRGGLVKRLDGAPSPVRLLTGHKGPVRIAVFSPDGKLALSCGGWPQGDKTLRLWDVATARELRAFAGNKLQLQSAAFSPDGRHVAAGEDNGVIHLWEAKSGQLVRQFKGHGAGAIPQLRFSGDGKWLLSAGNDKTVRLWDVATAKQKQAFKGHTDWARTAIFLPDGQRILTGGRDKTVRAWRIADGELLRTITQPEVVEDLAATRDGKRWVAGGGNLLRVYDAATGKLTSQLSGHAYGVTSLALAKDDRTALTSSYDGSVRAWDLVTGAPLYRLGSHREWVWSVALSPDGKHALTAGGGGQQAGQFVPGSDFAIRLWRLPDAEGAAVARAP